MQIARVPGDAELIKHLHSDKSLISVQRNSTPKALQWVLYIMSSDLKTGFCILLMVVEHAPFIGRSGLCVLPCVLLVCESEEKRNVSLEAKSDQSEDP